MILFIISTRRSQQIVLCETYVSTTNNGQRLAGPNLTDLGKFVLTTVSLSLFSMFVSHLISAFFHALKPKGWHMIGISPAYDWYLTRISTLSEEVRNVRRNSVDGLCCAFVTVCVVGPYKRGGGGPPTNQM